MTQETAKNPTLSEIRAIIADVISTKKLTLSTAMQVRYRALVSKGFELGVLRTMQSLVEAGNAKRLDMDAYAKGLATAAVLASDDNRAYILQAKADPKGFVVHPWVIAAIQEAFRDGLTQRDADHDLIVQNLEEKWQEDSRNMVMATMAASMEQFLAWRNEHMSGTTNTMRIEVDLEAQRTIWDRLNLEVAQDGDKITHVVTLK